MSEFVKNIAISHGIENPVIVSWKNIQKDERFYCLQNPESKPNISGREVVLSEAKIIEHDGLFLVISNSEHYTGCTGLNWVASIIHASNDRPKFRITQKGGPSSHTMGFII